MSEETDLARLARIGDSVFAVVVTLLAYRVRLPSGDDLAARSFEALAPFTADLAAVVLSFGVATLFWMLHWAPFRRMRRIDTWFVYLHFAFLGALVLLPISTSIMSHASDGFAGAGAYSANLFLLAAAETLFRFRARRLEPQPFGDVPLLVTPALLMLIFGSAAIASLFASGLASALWCAALITPLIERRWGLGRLSRAPAPPA